VLPWSPIPSLIWKC